MSEQLSKQASELWNTISAPQTAETYKNTFTLTWQILKRLGLTVWLALCLIIVAADWIADTAIRSGKTVRLWLENLQNQDSEKLAAVTGEQLVSLSKQSLFQTVANARKQLGLPEKQMPPQLPPAAAPEVTDMPTKVEATVEPK